MIKYLVSVVVPCYNQSHFLSEALQSVLNQTYSDWECIIVNDGSPDDTEKVAKEWIRKDSRFKYIYKDNGGLSSARNAGIEMAEGEFILPLDADDKIGNEYLIRAVGEFAKDDRLKIVYCKAYKFGQESGELLLKPYSLAELAQQNMVFCTALYKKNEWEIIGGYDAKLKYGLEDWEFWISMLEKGGGVCRLNYFGFYYRINQESMIKSFLDSAEKSSFSYKYISVKHAEFFISHLGSFKELTEEKKSLEKEFSRKLNSKKFVINACTKLLFGFELF